MFWKKTEDIDESQTKQEENIPSSSSSICCSRNEDDDNMPVPIDNVNNDDNNKIKLSLPPSNISPSKRCAHIVSLTSGLMADPIHFHSFTLVGSSGSGWSIPSPKSLFVGAFQKCSACHGRLGGSTNVANDIASRSSILFWRLFLLYPLPECTIVFTEA